MRLFIYRAIAIPLLLADMLVVWAAPGLVTRFYSCQELFSVGGGVVVYLGFHVFIRKPERLYLWGHELTHLVIAKLFLRTVHGFHITSRDGGRVVIDGTNVWIDLAPYLFPFYGLLLMLACTLLRPAPPWGTTAYLVGGGFLLGMHLLFSLEGFRQGQPDLLRSGRLFSFALFLLFLAAWIPLVFAPGTPGGWGRIESIYLAWGKAALETGNDLFLSFRAFRF